MVAMQLPTMQLLTRKLPEHEVKFWLHVFPGERAPSQSDEIDIHFSLVAPDDRNLM